MSIFLDRQPSQNKLYPDNSLIHTYNKKIFADYNTAVEQLMYKVLCPGEIGFAYYYDENSEYGINAIFAVGPIIQGGGNILFKNALELNQIFNELNNTITNINVSINKIQTDLFNELYDVSVRLDKALCDTLNKVTGPLNIYQQQINDINQDLYEIKIDIKTKASQEQLDSLILQHDTDITNINNKIQTNFDTLLIHIDKQKEDILKYIQEAIRDSISHTDDKSDQLVNGAKTELQKAFKTIQDEYYGLYNEVKKHITDLTEKHNRDINLLHTTVNNLTYEVEFLKDNLFKLQDSISNNYNELNNKIDKLSHRFIHHLSEHPDNFNKDLIE